VQSRSFGDRAPFFRAVSPLLPLPVPLSAFTGTVAPYTIGGAGPLARGCDSNLWVKSTPYAAFAIRWPRSFCWPAPSGGTSWYVVPGPSACAVCLVRLGHLSLWPPSAQPLAGFGRAGARVAETRRGRGPTVLSVGDGCRLRHWVGRDLRCSGAVAGLRSVSQSSSPPCVCRSWRL
jgi:hypothetical protein